MTTPSPSALSAFSSLGGMDLGLEAAGYRLVEAIELDELARDPVNCLLSYAYALLTKDLTAVAIAVGFDPYLGVLHRPRFGRPALDVRTLRMYRSPHDYGGSCSVARTRRRLLSIRRPWKPSNNTHPVLRQAGVGGCGTRQSTRMW